MTEFIEALLTALFERHVPVALPWEVWSPFATMNDRIRRIHGVEHAAAIVAPNYLDARGGARWFALDAPDGNPILGDDWAPTLGEAMQAADIALRAAGWRLCLGPTKPYRDPLLG